MFMKREIKFKHNTAQSKIALLRGFQVFKKKKIIIVEKCMHVINKERTIYLKTVELNMIRYYRLEPIEGYRSHNLK